MPESLAAPINATSLLVIERAWLRNKEKADATAFTAATASLLTAYFLGFVLVIYINTKKPNLLMFSHCSTLFSFLQHLLVKAITTRDTIGEVASG